MWSRAIGAAALSTILAASAEAQTAANWIPAGGNWNVPGNWSNGAAPDNGGGTTYAVQIGNTAPSNAVVTFVPVTGASATVTSLGLTDGADLLTSGRQLNVTGATTISGAGSTIRVDANVVPTTASLVTADLDATAGGTLQMNGGIATVAADVDIAGVLSGYGTLNVGDADAAAEQAFQNSGMIQVSGTNDSPGLLTIHAVGLDTINLDGDSNTGDVTVANAVADLEADTLTLVVDGPLTDGLGGAVGGVLSIGQRDTVTFNQNFAFEAGYAISMDGGNNVARLNGAGAVTNSVDADFTITNDAVIANNMTFTGTLNTITVNANSSLELAGTVNLPDASAISLTSSSELIISGTTIITEVTDFNWDGPGAATTTVKGAGLLSLTVNRVDVGDDSFTGTLNLNDDGDVSVNNLANTWTMAGALHKQNAGSSSVSGESVNVTGAVTVDAGGTLAMPTTTLSAGANVNVAGTLTLATASTLAGPTTLTGTGTLRLLGTSTVTTSTTINTTGFDWDGATSLTLHTINDAVVFTINSTVWDDDDIGDMDDPINLGGNGAQLAVNGINSWSMTRTLTTNTSVLGIATLGGSSRMILIGATGIWNANGQTSVNAPVTFGASSTANIAAAGFIRLNGGDGVSVFNRIEGGTINGPGALISINTRELRGFGTINAPITFQNASSLRADDGTLTLGGVINEVSTIGTADADGTLNVVNAWNSNVAANVVLNGGTLQGGAITVANSNGIKGRGLVSSRVVNNSRLEANVAASTLVFETAANDNDWDGGSNTGILAASNGGTLEVRDNATFTFGGTVTATTGSRVYTKGFGMNFASSSTINLTAAKLQADESTNIDGQVNVASGGASTIEVQVNRFLTIGSTAVLNLNSNLNLVTNNGAVEAGATFNGSGAVIVPEGSHLIPEHLSNINTLLVNGGTIRPAGFNTVGRATMFDYQQLGTGLLEVELIGTLLNQYDRLLVNGDAVLSGKLVVDIDGAFVPALGDTFNIITAHAVVGQFTSTDVSGMPVGLTFHINYLSNAVQLQVVNTPSYSADFDNDGDVDTTDYAVWRNAFDLNQLGDADGDNDSDGFDFLVWQQQYGVAPAVPAGAAVPEPSGIAMLAVGVGSAAANFCRRSRRRFA